MTSNRRTYDGPRRPRRARHRPLRVALLALLAVLVLNVAARSTLILFLVLAAVAFLLWHRRRTAQPVRGRAEPAEITRMRAQLDQAEAELAGARRSIDKLEGDAAKHDALVERIEAVTRRPVELHVADLERARGQYRGQP